MVGKGKSSYEADAAVFASSFDSLVAVLVECSKVFPEFFVGASNLVGVAHVCEFGSEATKSSSMIFVLMTLLSSCG
jgi:hypothetical protein